MTERRDHGRQGRQEGQGQEQQAEAVEKTGAAEETYRPTGTGQPQVTISHVLNQSDGGPRVTQVYARHDFEKEKRVALEAWGRHLDAVLTGQTSQVVTFPGGRPRR